VLLLKIQVDIVGLTSSWLFSYLHDFQKYSTVQIWFALSPEKSSKTMSTHSQELSS